MRPETGASMVLGGPVSSEEGSAFCWSQGGPCKKEVAWLDLQFTNIRNPWGFFTHTPWRPHSFPHFPSYDCVLVFHIPMKNFVFIHILDFIVCNHDSLYGHSFLDFGSIPLIYFLSLPAQFNFAKRVSSFGWFQAHEGFEPVRATWHCTVFWADLDSFMGTNWVHVETSLESS